MKKVLLAIVFVIGVIQFSHAQVSFGIKAGINSDLNGQASKFITLPTGSSIESESSNGGYHAGAWLRVKVPVVGFYIRPEIIYTNLNSEYTLMSTVAGYENSTIEYSLTKVDVPILLGLKFLKFGNIFVGPNVQYLLKYDVKSAFYNEDTIDEELSVGLIIGAGIEFWKLGLDVRFETGFVNPKSTDISSVNTSADLEPIVGLLTGQKPNQVIIGLSYKL